MSRNTWGKSLYAFFYFTLVGSSPAIALNEQAATNLATDAYIYGYPLVTMEMTRRVMTNSATPSVMSAPMGQFAHMREYPNPSLKEVTTPNADTLYSVAWLDLTKEPYILHIPNEGDRYFLMPILSAWTDVIADPGTRLGTKEQNFAIIGPDWQGTLPKDVTAIHSPTDLMWILGRTYSSGTPEDYKAVHAIQDQYTLTPLSAYGKAYTPPKGIVNPSIDMKTPVRQQVNNLDAATYFKTLAALLKDNPPAAEDKDMVNKLMQLGITPGKDFDISQVEPTIAKGLNHAVKAGQAKILAYQKDAGKVENGWLVFNKTGRYDGDYLNRAFVTLVGLGANLPQDALYPEARVDSAGHKLNGANKYVMHFTKGQTPPVKGFWSLTMYDTEHFFVANALNRYTLSERDALKYNLDGSLDFYIQHESPGKDKESNWLPAPKGNFILMLRFYWPEEALINGTWSPPPVQKVK
ncbi:MAG: DUF1254 domain-containing protein [Gammaproteobacteria bacterium]